MRKRSSPPGPSQAAALTFNATPLVDVFFMLTIFYMLVTRFSSAEQVPMQLPKPEGSQAATLSLPDRVIVNCRPADPEHPDDSPVLYSLGPNRPQRLGVISDRLADLKTKRPDIKVVVRADKRLPYEKVRRLMGIIARHQIEMLNVVAHVSEEE